VLRAVLESVGSLLIQHDVVLFMGWFHTLRIICVLRAAIDISTVHVFDTNNEDRACRKSIGYHLQEVL